MTLTLWRGEQPLGELRKLPPSRDQRVARSDRPPTLSAVLVPSARSPALSGIWQIRPAIPGFGVQQEPIEPDIVADRDRRAMNHQSNPGPGALEPMSPEQIAGVPREMQLTIRDELGQVWLPQQICLEEVRYGSEHIEMAGREVPPEAMVDGSIWRVFVVFVSDLESPAA